jgi:hypothetical protein
MPCSATADLSGCANVLCLLCPLIRDRFSFMMYYKRGFVQSSSFVCLYLPAIHSESTMKWLYLNMTECCIQYNDKISLKFNYILMYFDTWHTLDFRENIYRFLENFPAPVGYREREKLRLERIECLFLYGSGQHLGHCRQSDRSNVSPCCLYRQSQNCMQHRTENTEILVNV